MFFLVFQAQHSKYHQTFENISHVKSSQVGRRVLAQDRADDGIEEEGAAAEDAPPLAGPSHTKWKQMHFNVKFKH